MTNKIVLVDDHAIVRSGVRTVLEQFNPNLKIVAELSNGKELLEYSKAHKDIDVYIVDIVMPRLNGIEALSSVSKHNPQSNIIVLSMYDDRVSVEESLKAGAKGFIVKVSAADEIAQAVEEILKGKFYLSTDVSKYIVQGFLGKNTSSKKTRDRHGLTHKEKEILQLIAESNSSKQIAKLLNISLNTVHVHRNNMMRKLNIHKQAELVRYALKEGIAQL
jgi:DNA-binding NarL/FixJ family response regulator